MISRRSVTILLFTFLCVVGCTAFTSCAHSHELYKVDGVEATCTENGTQAYYACSDCDMIFSDAEGTESIEKPQVIEKISHKFVDGTCEYGCGYHQLTLKKASAQDLEGTDGVYAAKEGTLVTITADKADEDYEFAGFKREGSRQKESKDSATYTFTMPNEPVSYTAVYLKYYTVSFDLNGGKGTIASQRVLSGSTAEAPTPPSYSYTAPTGETYRFVFEDWYYGLTPWNFETDVVTRDITLRAKWTFEEDFFAVKENASLRADGATIRALSFNVLADDWSNKPAVAPRATGAVNTILRYLPDVVGLQECDDQWYAALNADEQLHAKYRFVNYSSSGQNKVTINGKKYTNYSTILYNTDVLELIEWKQQPLTPSDNKKCRIFTVAVFEIKESGKQFIFTSTHWDLTEEQRLAQANGMKSLIDGWRTRYPNIPLVMSGDYNAPDSESSLVTLIRDNNLTDSKNAIATGLVCSTFHLGNGMFEGSRNAAIAAHWLRGRVSVTPQNVTTTECIDHILLSSGIESLYYDTIHDEEALDASDHMPIYCDLRF